MRFAQKRWQAVMLAASLLFTCAGPSSAREDATIAVTPPPQGSVVRPIAFSKLLVALQPGEKYGVLLLGPLCVPHESLYWESARTQLDQKFAETFVREVSAGGFKIAGDPNNLFESSDASAEYLVAGQITALSARFCFLLSMRA